MGFLANSATNTCYEDRNNVNTGRYGHRDGPFSKPNGSDQYLDDQATGCKYKGSDAPNALHRAGYGGATTSFRIRVWDKCEDKWAFTGNTVTINWQEPGGGMKGPFVGPLLTGAPGNLGPGIGGPPPGQWNGRPGNLGGFRDPEDGSPIPGFIPPEQWDPTHPDFGAGGTTGLPVRPDISFPEVK